MNQAVRGKLTKLGNIFDTLLIIFMGYFFFHQGPKMNPVDLYKYTGAAPLSLCTAAPILQNKKIVKESRRWLYKGYLQCTFKEIKPLNNFLNITYNDYIYYSISPSRNK